MSNPSPAGPPGPSESMDPEYAAESNTARIVAVVTIFHVIALASVVARLWARVWIVRSPGWDDWIMVLAALCAMGGWIIFIIQAHYGLGKHQDTILPADYQIFQHVGFWQSIISAAGALMWLKISIALGLLRLSQKTWYKWSLWGTIVLTAIYCIGGMFPFFLRCRPMAGFWDKSLEPKCYDISLFITFGLVNTAFNIFTDVVLATLPVPIVWNLQMKRRVKISVVGILSMGYLAVGMGITKAVYQIAYGAQPDKTFNQSVQFWGFLQLQLGIIAGCAPSLKPFFGRILGNTSVGKGNYYGQSSRSRHQIDPGLQTIGGSGAPRNTSRIKSQYVYELDEHSLDEGRSTDGHDSGSSGHKTTIEGGANFVRQREGSEDRILEDPARPRPPSNGVMMVTEVIVR